MNSGVGAHTHRAENTGGSSRRDTGNTCSANTVVKIRRLTITKTKEGANTITHTPATLNVHMCERTLVFKT